MKINVKKNSSFDFSPQERIQPYYVGWIVAKLSIWADDINLHILICHQVQAVQGLQENVHCLEYFS